MNRLKVVILTVALLMLWLFYINVPSVCDSSLNNANDFRERLRDETQVIDDVGMMQGNRLRHLKKTCLQMKKRTYGYHGIPDTRYLWSKRYKFGICKVAKCGSSLFVQIFRFLRDGKKTFGNLSQESRHTLHRNLEDRFGIAFATVSSRPSVLVTRNPFSRLYSAYIDKILTPLMLQLNTDILDIIGRKRKSQDKCEELASFQDFLDYIVKSGSQQETFNRHWAPVSSLCLPCQTKPFAIIKQETFNTDLNYALETAGVETDKIQSINEAMEEQGAESNVISVIKAVESHVQDNMNVFGFCKGGNSVLARMWKAFQIQGYINADLDFPVSTYDSHFVDFTHFIKTVLDTIKFKTVSPIKRKAQRLAFLVNAYSVVKKETLRGIQYIYKDDFDLFDYEYDRPSE